MGAPKIFEIKILLIDPLVKERKSGKMKQIRDLTIIRSLEIANDSKIYQP